MNKYRVSLMLKMLLEVQAGTWKGIKLKQETIEKFGPEENIGKPDTFNSDTFNLSCWIEKNSASPCGYTACAIGHATLDPRFHKLGLRKDNNGYPKFMLGFGFDAVHKFFNFDINYIEHLLYSPSHYPKANSAKTLEQVIRRHKLLLEVGEEQFKKKFTIGKSNKKLVSPQGRVYNVKY